MLIVTGGEYGGNAMDSTEVAFAYHLKICPMFNAKVMVYGSQEEWREVGRLPEKRVGLRGATVDGIFYVSGGGDDQHTDYTNQLASFDPVSESWAPAGKLTFSRKWHAVAEIDLSTMPSANCSLGSKYI